MAFKNHKMYVEMAYTPLWFLPYKSGGHDFKITFLEFYNEEMVRKQEECNGYVTSPLKSFRETSMIILITIKYVTKGL